NKFGYEMDNFLTPIVAAVATVICNAAYFAFVKNKIEKQIESYKIAYSGIFKEKVDIYKELLRTMDELKDRIVTYGHTGREDFQEFNQLKQEINNFIRLYQYGSMFYPKKIVKTCTQIRDEFQLVFESSARLFLLEKHGRSN